MYSAPKADKNNWKGVRQNLDALGHENIDIQKHLTETTQEATNTENNNSTSTRRAFLSMTAAGAAAAAGCTITGTPDTTPTNSPTETDSSTATETATPEPEWEYKEMWQLMPQFEVEKLAQFRIAEPKGVQAAEKHNGNTEEELAYGMTTIVNEYNYNPDHNTYEDTQEGSKAAINWAWSHLQNKDAENIILNTIPSLAAGRKVSSVVGKYEENGETHSFIFGHRNEGTSSESYQKNPENSDWLTDEKFTNSNGEKSMESRLILGGDFDFDIWVKENYPEAFADHDESNREFDNASTGITIGPGMDENYTFGPQARQVIPDMQQENFGEFMEWTLKLTNDLGKYRHNNPDSEYQVLNYNENEGFQINDISEERLDELKTEYE